MANRNGWDFAIVVALLVFLYYAIKELAPLCKEMSVEHKPDGHIKFTALTHDKENEIGDANPPLVLQGN